jgi:hypothetical protein
MAMRPYFRNLLPREDPATPGYGNERTIMDQKHVDEYEDMKALLHRETQDGPGTDDFDSLPESDFDGFPEDEVEKEASE